MSKRPTDQWEKFLKRERGDYDPRTNEHRALAPPIEGLTGKVCTSIAYLFDNAEEAAATFAAEPGARDYAYSRIAHGQPPVEALRQKLLDLELGEGNIEKEKYNVVLTSSGMAASFLLALQHADNQGEFIASPKLYGGTYQLFTKMLPRLGITCHMIENPQDLGEWRRCIEAYPNAKFLFAEDDANPKPIKLDNHALASLAHEFGIFYVCDRTIGTPALEKPLLTGTDVVIHSLSKEIGGRSGGLGGAIIGKREFIDPMNNKDLGWFAPTGMVMDARVADYMLHGAGDLVARMERKSTTAARVAEFLKSHPKVKEVYGPGGSLLAFEINGELVDAQRVMESLQMIKFTPHLGDLETLAIHPASTTHSPVPAEKRKKLGISDTLIRISVGLEDPEKIIADLRQALDK